MYDPKTGLDPFAHHKGKTSGHQSNSGYFTVVNPDGSETEFRTRGYGGFAVTKTVEEWNQINAQKWDKFREKNPAPPPPIEHGTWGYSNSAESDAISAGASSASQYKKTPRIVDDKSTIQKVLESFFAILFISALCLTLFMLLIK